MFDSKTDKVGSRPSWKLEDKFIGFHLTAPTYRSVHQEPAPDFDKEPEMVTVSPKGMPPYTTQSTGFAVVIQTVSPTAKARSWMPQQRRKATAGRYRF